MNKDEARRVARAVWDGLTLRRRQHLRERLAVRLSAGSFERIFATVPIREELELLSIAQDLGLPIYLPVAGEGGQMAFFFSGSGRDSIPLIPGRFGIPVPPAGIPVIPGQGDLCLIPSLGCNAGRFRLGRGGGYFDRFFSANPSAKKCVKLSVLPAELTEIHFSEQLHDLKLDEVLTDTWTVVDHAGD